MANIYRILEETVATYDKPLGGAWRLEGMPEVEIAPRLKAIVGVEMPIERLEGKIKLNQEKTPSDRAGVVAALEATGDSQAGGLHG